MKMKNIKYNCTIIRKLLASLIISFHSLVMVLVKPLEILMDQIIPAATQLSETTEVLQIILITAMKVSYCHHHLALIKLNWFSLLLKLKHVAMLFTFTWMMEMADG